MSKQQSGGRAGRGEDHRLAEENYPTLNKTFYEMEPQAYLRQRWLHLALAAGKGDELDQLALGGIHAGRLRYYAADAEIERHRHERERFVIAESEVLTHHVGETLLRLYLAHADVPACPWLELARVRSPAKFKKAVENLCGRLSSGEDTERIRTVFYGTADPRNLQPAPDDARFKKGTSNIIDFLSLFARTCLDAAPYNAAKHGLALLAEDSDMRIEADDEEEPVLAAGGPAIQYLAVRERQGRPRWMRETKWINSDRAHGLIGAGCGLIGQLWAIGAWRYLGRRSRYPAASSEVVRDTDQPFGMSDDRPLAEITDPGGAAVALPARIWEAKVTRDHPELRGCLEQVLSTVSAPDHVEPDPRPERRRYYRRGVGPSRWLMVVVSFEQLPGRIITALALRKDPKQWKP